MYANYSGCRTVSNQRERDYNVRSRSYAKHRAREGGRAVRWWWRNWMAKLWAAFENGKCQWCVASGNKRRISAARSVLCDLILNRHLRRLAWTPGWVSWDESPVIRVFTMAQPLMRFISLVVSLFLLLLFRLLWFLPSNMCARTHAASSPTHYI